MKAEGLGIILNINFPNGDEVNYPGIKIEEKGRFWRHFDFLENANGYNFLKTHMSSINLQVKIILTFSASNRYIDFRNPTEGKNLTYPDIEVTFCTSAQGCLNVLATTVSYSLS